MKKIIIISSIVLVVGGGIYYFYKRQIELLKELTYKPMGLQLVKLDMDESIINLKLRITSTSTIEAMVDELNLDFYLNGIKLANIVENRTIVIPARGYSDVDLKIAFSPQAIKENVVSLGSYFIQKKDALIRLNGYAKVKSAFMSLRLPFEYETTLKELMTT